MRFLKAIFGFLISRRFWTFVGLVLLCGLIWLFGPLVSVGDIAPLASELSRLVTIGVIVILWLISILIRLLRAARRNQMFVSELSQPQVVAEVRPGAANVEEVNAKFRGVLDEMKRSKLGSRKFLREMPWYLMIGPPGTGKTTALRQSGLHFPIDLSDDIKGVGGTRNCDWFFTEQAVLIDTAGRYVEQASDPAADAAEWDGFLAMLRKHRGRRALNGVIVAISVKELLGPDIDLQSQGREIRKRLAELREKLGIQLPVYLLVTKCDVIAGFEGYFADLTAKAREQVWGATMPTSGRIDGTVVEREFNDLLAQAERRLSSRMAEDAPLARRAEVFRFPAQMGRLEAPLKKLIDIVFGESRYEESPWLRGFYFTSGTQEGSPIDRLVGEICEGFGFAAAPPERRAHAENRSYFLRDLFAGVVFPEAGLGLFDRAAEERRKWLWRGSLATAALVTTVAGLVFLYSYLRYSSAITDQARRIGELSDKLANVASRQQAPTDPLDLDLALDAATTVQAARTEVATNALTLLGPTAEAEIARSEDIAYNRTLRNVLTPRMVALLEATMWREARDPDFLLGALKAYYMMTGLAPYDRDFVQSWWQEVLPDHAVIPVFPTEAARAHQLAAIDRLAIEEQKFEPDKALVATALQSICTIPLSKRAYDALKQDPTVTALPEWIPAEKAGPNAASVLTRLSQKTLRIGLPGAFTYQGFNDVILPLIPEVAAQAALDRAIFAGGCAENSDASVATLETDILKLYGDDFIAQWDGFLRDVRLAPITDLRVANANLKDLASADSTLKRLLREVVDETDLTRVPDADAGGADVPQGVIGAVTKRLGKIGKLAKGGAKIAKGIGGGAAGGAAPGADIAAHFAPLKAVITETDGVPPLITDAEAALGALANELQTVAASPDPQAALLARGGLPQLTGQLANVAKALPSPINDWIAGIAGDTISVTREAVIDQLNARWRADVLPFCTSATAGRYPFEPGSAIDVNVADFQRLFGPSGMIDGFTTELLLPYVDTTVRPWTWRADFGLDPAKLAPFEQARAIRDGLFPGGAGPVMAFTLEPKDLSANASRVTLNLDGQQLVYFNSAARPMPMTWPGRDGTNLISLTFTPVDGTAEAITSETGAWAWLRMIRKGSLQKSDLPELFRLTLSLGGFSAQYDLRANSVENPFDLSMFGNFRCPQDF